MTTTGADFIFPPRVIPELRDLRGDKWQELIDKISTQSSDEPDRVALVLTMVRLCGCTSCQADSFKAMRGCSMCATLTIKRFKGSDMELINLIEAAKFEFMNNPKNRFK